jgi:hypothetical protein
MKFKSTLELGETQDEIFNSIEIYLNEWESAVESIQNGSEDDMFAMEGANLTKCLAKQPEYLVKYSLLYQDAKAVEAALNIQRDKTISILQKNTNNSAKSLSDREFVRIAEGDPKVIFWNQLITDVCKYKGYFEEIRDTLKQKGYSLRSITELAIAQSTDFTI